MANLMQFTGKLRAVKDGYTEQEFSGGLIKKRIRAQMICGDSTQWIEASALVWKDEKKNIIRTYKRVENGKDEKLDVKWADRFNEDIVSSVPGYRRWVIDTDTYATRKALEDAGQDEELAKSKKKRKEFLHAADFIDYLVKVLNNEKSKDMVFRVSGTIDFSYSANSDQYYRVFTPQKIWRVESDVEQTCEGSLKLYFTEGAVDDEEADNYFFNTYAQYYDTNVKANAFVPISFKIAKDHPKAKGFKTLFNRVSGDEVKELGVTVAFINGAQRVNLTEDMLSDEQRELLDLGMTTLDEIRAEMGGSVYGERVTENRLTGLMRGYSKGVVETTYEATDLIKKPIKVEEKVEVVDDDIDIFDDEDEDI
jgi:hypothetical protein